MLEIIDLSQEIFPGMPVFPGMPEVEITLHASHEQWAGLSDSEVVSPAVNRLELGEHSGAKQRQSYNANAGEAPSFAF